MFLIYKLFHPLSNKVYIGKTNNIKRRFKKHLSDKDITKKTCWIKSLKNKYNDKPSIEIIQNNIIDDDWANSYEISWIAYYRNNYGFDNILNGSDGGEGFKAGHQPANAFKSGHIESKETYEKRCLAIKNNLPTTAFKKGIIPSNRRFKDIDIINIKELYLDGLSFRKLAKEFEVDKSVISDIVNNKTYILR